MYLSFLTLWNVIKTLDEISVEMTFCRLFFDAISEKDKDWMISSNMGDICKIFEKMADSLQLILQLILDIKVNFLTDSFFLKNTFYKWWSILWFDLGAKL